MDQYIGKMLDNRYEILECIGTGGMAVVYKARCHRLNRFVAVKILKPEFANDADIRRRFHDESQAVAMLSHVNIVGIYDVSHSADLDYIVMELVDGMTLKQYMKRRGTPLNWREALHFITQIVRALSHAHSRGIIHRDIKPQNVMVLRDGSVKVTDFGIARVSSSTQSTLTQEALGSVHYISPEQARGSHIDGRSDLYSAGVVLYEMLTGRLPFEGDTPVSVAIQHINSIPIPPRDLNPSIPLGLEKITLKAMAPKPENRYSSADEMLADLEAFRKNPDMIPAFANTVGSDEVDEPTKVVPVENIKMEEQRLGRETSGGGTVRHSDPKEEEDDEPQKRRFVPILIAVCVIIAFVVGVGLFVYNFMLKDMFATVEEFVVPDVTIYTIEQIQQHPELSGDFTVVVGETINSEQYAEGAIVSQDPSAGSKIKEGGSMTITVTVSAGEEIIYLPNVVDEEARSAASTLRNLGFIVETEYEYNDEIISGNVIETYPVQGTAMKSGDTVTLTISQGKKNEEATVINFVGMNINNARTNAELLGLVVGTVTEEYNDKYEEGQVIYQSLAVNESVEKGTVINFRVSLGPEPVPSEPEPEESEEPEETEDISDSLAGSTTPIVTTKTINVDLSGYDGVVSVRVDVNGTVFQNGTVDLSEYPSSVFPVIVSGSGTQTVSIYVNDVLIDTYSLNFNG